MGMKTIRAGGGTWLLLCSSRDWESSGQGTGSLGPCPHSPGIVGSGLRATSRPLEKSDRTQEQIGGRWERACGCRFHTVGDCRPQALPADGGRRTFRGRGAVSTGTPHPPNKPEPFSSSLSGAREIARPGQTTYIPS